MILKSHLERTGSSLGEIETLSRFHNRTHRSHLILEFAQTELGKKFVVIGGYPSP